MSLASLTERDRNKVTNAAKIDTVIQSYAVSMTLLLGLLLGGCNRSPKVGGQVVAIVGDEEITRAELELEARERGLPVGTDTQVRDGVVKELVERKLLVQEARKEKLDRTPEFVLASRRLGEISLAQSLIARGASSGVPAATLARFIAQNARAFDKRVLYSVDYLQIPGGLGKETERRLLGARTSAALAAILAEAGTKAERKQEVWDSASLAPAAFASLERLREGETFLLPGPEATVVGTLLTVSPQPLPKAQQASLAAAMIQQEAKQRTLARILQTIGSRTPVTYAPDFAPKGPKALR